MLFYLSKICSYIESVTTVKSLFISNYADRLVIYIPSTNNSNI